MTSMARRYGEPLQVQRRDDAPTQFLWRGRLYVVVSVLKHWFEAGTWWSSPAAAPLYGAEPAHRSPDPLVLAPIPASPRWGQRAWGEPAPDLGAVLDGGMVDQERELWRVEAGAGRFAGTGVYDLCFDWASGDWRIAAVGD